MTTHQIDDADCYLTNTEVRDMAAAAGSARRPEDPLTAWDAARVVIGVAAITLGLAVLLFWPI